jgi:hypothetical protein
MKTLSCTVLWIEALFHPSLRKRGPVSLLCSLPKVILFYRLVQIILLHILWINFNLLTPLIEFHPPPLTLDKFMYLRKFRTFLNLNIAKRCLISVVSVVTKIIWITYALFFTLYLLPGKILQGNFDLWIWDQSFVSDCREQITQ